MKVSQFVTWIGLISLTVVATIACLPHLDDDDEKFKDMDFWVEASADESLKITQTAYPTKACIRVDFDFFEDMSKEFPFGVDQPVKFVFTDTTDQIVFGMPGALLPFFGDQECKTAINEYVLDPHGRTIHRMSLYISSEKKGSGYREFYYTNGSKQREGHVSLFFEERESTDSGADSE